VARAACRIEGFGLKDLYAWPKGCAYVNGCADPLVDDEIDEHTGVLEPGDALDERTQMEPVGAGLVGRGQVHDEPPLLPGRDVRRGLLRGAIRREP